MEKRISGHTKLMALFGTPVDHSGSPAMYNFAFAHDELDYAYLAFDVNVEGMEEAFKAVRLLDIVGGNFTMPVKNIAAELVDSLSPAAKIVGACNTFVNKDGHIEGHITDGIGFVKNLEKHGVSVEGKKVVLLGAGGAGTAVTVQLALDGVKELIIFNEKDAFFDRAMGTKEKLAKETSNVHVEVMDLADEKALKEAIENADLLINTTSVGMAPNSDSLVDKAYLHKDLIVADTVYNPEKTTLILDAEAIGCKAVGGKGMLLEQGVANYELFVGRKFPTEEFQKFNK